MTDYSPEELKMLVNAPMLLGMSVAMADLGIISTAIEAAALSGELVKAGKNFPNNSAIQAVFSEEAIRSGKIRPEKPDISPEDVQSGGLVDKALASANAAIAILETKATPEEVAEYKQFLYHCGEKVAEAAGDGLFGSGTKVSAKEAATLAKIRAGLGI